MATTLENALRLVKPGEMVVSLTDILDRLGTKITDDERKQLLIAMLSPRREKVQPGDLITSDLMNQVLTDIVDLQDRVGRLEAPSGSTGRTKITNLLPSGTKRIGDTLHIIGSGFNAAGSTAVLIDNMQVLPTPGPLRDTELVVRIPNLQNVGANGRTVTVLVSNLNGSDSQDFQVYPAIETLPQGNLFINLTASPPGNLSANTKPVFEFTVSGFLNIAERFLLEASTTAGWQCDIMKNNVVVPGPNIDLPVALPPDGMPPAVIQVRVTIPASPATSLTKLYLRLKSQKNAAFERSSPGDQLALGLAGPTPDPISMALDRAEATNSNIQPSPTRDGNTVKIPGGAGSYRLTFNAMPLVSSAIYTKSIGALSGVGWTASFSRTSSVTEEELGPVGAISMETFSVFVTAAAGASAIELSIQLVSKTNANDKGHINQPLAVS